MALSKDRADAVWEGSVTDGGGRVTVASAAFPEQPITLKRRTEGGRGTTSPEELIAAAHVCASVPNFYRLEHAVENIPMQNELLTEPMDISDGAFRLNEKPGLGYDLDPDALASRRHPLWEG